MSRKQIAQIFTTANSYVPTKAALHLRPAGSPQKAFVLTSTADTVIDPVNFADVLQGANYITVNDTDLSFTGAGYLSTHGVSTVSIEESPTTTYPLQSSEDGQYTIYFRLKSFNSYSISLLLDNIPFTTLTGSSTDWTWVSSNVVVFDNAIHKLGLSLSSPGLLIDKIVIRKTPSMPTGIGPDYTTSPYATVILRLAQVTANLPTTFYDVMAYRTTLTIPADGWYSFDLNALTATDIASQEKLALAVLAAGVSPTHYVIWDVANQNVNPIATQIDSNGWVLDSLHSMAVQIYSDFQAVNEYCTIDTPEATLKTLHQGDFSPLEIKPKLTNTIYVDDDEYGSDVELDVGDKLISFIVDQSGSQTWNDNTGVRFDFANTVLDVLHAKYPGNVNYNLIEFHGEPCFSFIIPLTEKITSEDVSDIIKAHFANDSDHFAGFRVIRKIGSYPSGPSDGEIVFDGYALAALDVNLNENTTYYYTVYTYDQHLTDTTSPLWSKGVQLRATTHELIVPRGIAGFTGTVLQGYDIRSDTNTLALWQMDEGSGDYVYDFASSNTTLTVNNATWISPTEVPTGISGLRFNGINSQVSGNANNLLNFTYGDSFTVCGWIYLFEIPTTACIIRQGNNSHYNWQVFLTSTFLNFGRLGSSVTCGIGVSIDTWTHFACVYNAGVVSFYLDGVLINSATITPTTEPSDSQSISIGLDPTGFFNPFFGKLSHLSIHNVARTAGEIAVFATPVLGQDENGNPQPVDNGDRLVVLNYTIPDDFNYSSLRIVRNAIQPPATEEDGTVILETSATPGRYTFSAGYPYDLGEQYWFRIFTQNSTGNWCDIRDAHTVTVTIPSLIQLPKVDDQTGAKSTPNVEFASTDPVTILIDRVGNEKVYLKWTPPGTPCTRVKIYYSSTSFPYYDAKNHEIAGGSIIFDAPVGVNEFVHRKIPNRQTAYYAIIPFDRLGRFADPGNWVLTSHFPLEQLDDTGIPLLEAKNVSYNLVDYDRIRITWDSPVEISSSLSAYYDDQFYVYGAICDMYGKPIPIAFPDGLTVTTTLNDIQPLQIEDVFRLGLDTANANQIPVVDWQTNPDGLITGQIRLRPSNLFAVLPSLSLSISAKYVYSSSYSFTFPSGVLTFQNPLDLKLVNRDKLYFSTSEFEQPNGCEVDEASGADPLAASNSPARKQVNGTYIRRKLPFAIRAFYTYKGQPIKSSRVSVRVFDAAGGPCEMAPTSITRQSTTVKLLSTSFPLQSQTVPIVDGNGDPTGYTEKLTFSDIFVIPPYLPQSASVFVRLDALAYIAVKKMNIFFPTILRLELSAYAPNPNNIDTREQFARAYLIDPDNPTDETKYTYPPDETIAKWEISKSNIPFYSIDSVPLVNGVYSYFRSGTARNVFFGPANATQAGIYTITVSATVRGLFASTFGNVEIKGLSGTDFEHFIPDPTQPRILCEFPDTINYIWADGLDYKKLTITRNPTDPSKSTTKYANKFRECSTAMLPLAPGTVVTVNAAGYEIIHGDVVEYIDGGLPRIDVSNALRALDVAQVTLSKDPYTYVYFRKNEFIEDNGCRDTPTAPCAAFDAPSKICFDPYSIGKDTAVTVSTKVNFAGKPLTIYGGGGFSNDGRPPCVLIPIEPLYVRYLGLFNNSGAPVNDFLLDKQTVHHMYFEIRFGGEPIPTGTAVPVFACNLLSNSDVCERINNSVGVPLIVYSYQSNHLPGQVADPYQEFSLIDIPIGPLGPDTDFSLGVYPVIEYNGNTPIVAES